MKGTIAKCDLTPQNSDYKYVDAMKDLIDKYQFDTIGEGGFGVILGNDSCVIKLVKDIKRCDEMTKEKKIYEKIEEQRFHLEDVFGKIPRFHIYSELSSFCHFNMERIFSPFSGFGDMEDDDDSKHGHGYVISDLPDSMYSIKQENKEAIKISKNEVYMIGRPGKLAHFYVNYKTNPDERFSLDNNQGVLMGQKTLEKLFTQNNVSSYTYAIGRLMAFLIFQCNILPTDVEVVIASRSKNDRTLCPYVYDFNECSFWTRFDPLIIARSMYYKNGKNYFPDKSNIYYNHFALGFLNTIYRDKAKLVLDSYNSLF